MYDCDHPTLTDLGPYTVTLLTTAPVDLRTAASVLTLAENHAIQRELDALIEKAAVVRGYLTRQPAQGDKATRYDDAHHIAGVKAANHLVSKLRRALGYAVTNLRITF